MLDEAIADHPVPNPLKIGYAGCALGTSEPALKDIAVMKMRNTYDIYVGGEPRGLKVALAKPAHTDLAPDQLAPIILKLIAVYQENGKKKRSSPLRGSHDARLRQLTLDARMDTAG